MTDKTPRPNVGDVSHKPSTWASDNWESRFHAVLLVVESIVFLYLIKVVFVALIPSAIDGAEAGKGALVLLKLVACGGALGGVLHMMTSFVSALTAGPVYRDRFFRLAFRPIVGAGLAVVVYLVLQTGLLSPVASSVPPAVSSVSTEATVAGTPTGGGATDVYRALAIACLTGLFARRAMDKLREVFFTLFQAKEQS